MDTTPKAWLCKHCGERVDPTMGLCWSCGHGKDGSQVDLDIQVSRKQYPHCPECQYDLRGIGDVDTCPECGFDIDRGQYETIWEERNAKRVTISDIKERRNLWVSRLGITFLIAIPLFFLFSILSVTQQYVTALAVGFVLISCLGWLLICIIQIASIFITPIRSKR